MVPDYSLNINIKQAQRFLTINGSVTFKMPEPKEIDFTKLYLNETMTDPVFFLSVKTKKQILKYRKVKGDDGRNEFTIYL